MRILADIADVKELKKAFKNNEDIHSLTASQVFNVPINKVNDDFRRKAKTINFGIIYGITQYGLAKQISVSNQEALDFINAYFKKFPQIKDYMNSTISICRKQGYVSNIFGRRIHLKGIEKECKSLSVTLVISSLIILEILFNSSFGTSNINSSCICNNIFV